jgi:hypothetical protein
LKRISPFTPHAGGEHVHAIDRLEERGLAGVGRADDAEDLVLANRQIDATQGYRVAVADRQVPDLELGRDSVDRRRGRAGG